MLHVSISITTTRRSISIFSSPPSSADDASETLFDSAVSQDLLSFVPPGFHNIAIWFKNRKVKTTALLRQQLYTPSFRLSFRITLRLHSTVHYNHLRAQMKQISMTLEKTLKIKQNNQ